MRSLSMLGGCLGLALCASVAGASTSEVPGVGSVRLLDRQGKPLRTLTHRYTGQAYVVGKPKQVYQIELCNSGHSCRRLFVTAVDGTNIITGQAATVHDEAGYVLQPGQRATIPGWKRGFGQAAQFYFTQVKESLAALVRGDISKAGTIGSAVYDERQRQPVYRGALRGGTRSLGLESASAERGLGTGYGDEVSFQTSNTEFVKATREPTAVLQLQYKTPGQLKKLGFSEAEIFGTGQQPTNPFYDDGPSVPAPPGWRPTGNH